MLRLSLAAAALVLLGLALGAEAQFTAFVQPARFELQAKPGEVVRDVLEIGNDGQAPAEFGMRTADWDLKADGGVVFRTDTLSADSCRPWVRLERYTLKVAGKAKRRFRFEVHVPQDALTGLCRFAMLVEAVKDATNVSPSDNISMPIQGRVGIIVYVRVGDARPRIVFEGVRVDMVNGSPTPVVVLRNEGNAHGRPEGVLVGTDAQGAPVDFTVASLPILPGESRVIPVWPSESAGKKSPAIAYPLKLTGRVEWEGGGHDIDTTLAR